MEVRDDSEEISEEIVEGQGESDLPYDENRRRLYLMRGLPCPLCGRMARRGRPPAKPRRRNTFVSPLAWTGVSLTCSRGHGWSNVQALHGDLGLGELGEKKNSLPLAAICGSGQGR